ncbi:uncharacterized protein LACBIDRAFT_329058 [Laccaria bicolor S238N-H82]|uniref:Predicted protein n=1 Tax=Laccaria bicolor (strain S238N-H82 / ATCC MYA-4686) TaxID=486041 RepID=B0DGX3_LACBS|nr:uncharacterized protein LACBIDRAFT_329058 [Laccaria bicolor S238N-H82]EDR06349.1 predicted protein [Laccaria bicolor S238N-H82]|eukprot:XP_001883210.1 predicted protein [Laccaria bicolor S238N-H82]
MVKVISYDNKLFYRTGGLLFLVLNSRSVLDHLSWALAKANCSHLATLINETAEICGTDISSVTQLAVSTKARSREMERILIGELAYRQPTRSPRVLHPLFHPPRT